MTTIRLEEGRLVIDSEEGPLTLPDDMSPAFLQAMFEIDDPDEDTHIAAIHRRLSNEDKDRFEAACREADEPFVTLWSKAAIAWASVGSLTGQWDLTGVKICYQVRIDSWNLKDALLTESGIWYVTGPHGTLTLPEFEAKYGNPIEKSLKDYVDFRKQICDGLLKTINGDMIWVEVQLELADGRLLIEKRRGPADIPVRGWNFGANEKFVATTDPEAQ